MKTPKWFLRKSPVALILVPVSLFYYVASRIVYSVRRMRAIKSRRPIICVGNILAGGVGKTPIVRAIANRFDAPVVMRGYKAAPGEVGDEASMLVRDGLAVHTGDRKSNIVLLNRQLGETGPIVMDDGFQNPTIKKDISVLVFDGTIGCGNGFMLPAGPMREPRAAAARADAIIIIGKNTKDLKLPNKPVFYATNKTVSPYDEDARLVAFAGIGYPQKFFKSLNNVVATKSFPDHYQYSQHDLDELFRLAEKKKAHLITTEKDWVRLPREVQDKIKYARLETVLGSDFWNWLKDRIDEKNS